METPTCTEDKQSDSMSEPLRQILKTSSETYFQLLDSTEFCKVAENTLKILKSKVRALSSTVQEAKKTKAELLSRHKADETNIDSLFQTQRQLYNYKYELKMKYIEAVEKFNKKKAKYDSLISFYTDKWKTAEEKYLELPSVSALSAVRNENALLHLQFVQCNELLKRSRKEFYHNREVFECQLKITITEFTKQYQNYVKYVNINEKIREKESELEKLVEESYGIHLQCKADIKIVDSLKIVTSGIVKHTAENNSNKCQTERKLFSIDLDLFDKITIPLESLEIQSESASLSNKEKKKIKAIKNKKEAHVKCDENLDETKANLGTSTKCKSDAAISNPVSDTREPEEQKTNLSNIKSLTTRHVINQDMANTKEQSAIGSKNKNCPDKQNKKSVVTSKSVENTTRDLVKQNTGILLEEKVKSSRKLEGTKSLTDLNENSTKRRKYSKAISKVQDERESSEGTISAVHLQLEENSNHVEGNMNANHQNSAIKLADNSGARSEKRTDETEDFAFEKASMVDNVAPRETDAADEENQMPFFKNADNSIALNTGKTSSIYELF